MKNLRLFAIIILLALALSACQGDGLNQPQDGDADPNTGPGESTSEEGMDFSEEDEDDEDLQDEIVFTEEEAASEEPQEVADLPGEETGDNGSEGELQDVQQAGGSAEMEFTEDEVEPIVDTTELILPPGGETQWEITHEVGSTTCPSLMETFGSDDMEEVTFEAGPPPTMDALIIYNFAGTDFIPLWRVYSNPVAEYRGEYKIPGTQMVLNFVVYFDNPAGASPASIAYGTISSEFQGCSVTRDFKGVLLGEGL